MSAFLYSSFPSLFLLHLTASLTFLSYGNIERSVWDCILQLQKHAIQIAFWLTLVLSFLRFPRLGDRTPTSKLQSTPSQANGEANCLFTISSTPTFILLLIAQDTGCILSPAGKHFDYIKKKKYIYI